MIDSADGASSWLWELIEAWLQEDLAEDAVDATMALTASTDSVFAELWDNPSDAQYDRL